MIKTSYLTSSPDQVKQSLRELKGLFENAKDRMKSPFGIVGELEVQKIEGNPKSAPEPQQTSTQDVFSALKREPVFVSIEEAEKSVPSGTKYRVGNKFYIKD